MPSRCTLSLVSSIERAGSSMLNLRRSAYSTMVFLTRLSVRSLLVVIFVVILCYYGYTQRSMSKRLLSSVPVSRRIPSRDTLENLLLTTAQCKAEFPLLTKEIDEAVARRPFRLRKAENLYDGQIEGRIRVGKVLYIRPPTCV